MRIPTLALIAALGVAAPSHAATRDFPATGFDRVQLSGVAEVTVHVGSGFAVHADGDDAAVDALTIEARNGALVIGMRPHTRLGRARLHVAVTMPRLVAVGADGTGSIEVDRVTGPAFEATLSGTGGLRLPSVEVGALHVSVSGTGAAHLAGRANRIALSLSGTGTIDAAKLVAGGGRIDASGVGSVHAAVNGPVAIDASGIGSVTVDGHPTCTIRKSGLGSVHCA